MKPNYSISIPKPCHEDWSQMTPNEKGRFCQSCTKTVVDFTKMSTSEIQDYIYKNKNQRICGHIKQSQLDTINLKIPETVFNQNLSFHRVFLLALLVSMGLTLFNCEDEKGRTKKIESVEIVESHKKAIDTLLNHDDINKIQLDTINEKKTKTSKTEVVKKELVEGMIIIETVGEVEVLPIDINDTDPVDIDDIETIDIDTLEGEVSTYCPRPKQDDVVFGLIVENPPEFKDTPKSLSRSEKREYLSNRITEIVKNNFNQEIANTLGLKGKQRIFTQFTVNEEGLVDDIKIRTNHQALEKEAVRVLKLFPQFKPAQQRGRNIAAVYSLPIVFIAED